MASSTFMTMLRQQLRLAAHGIQHNLSNDELMECDAVAYEHAQARAWSRREFLLKGVTAAAGATFLMSLDRATRAFAQDRRIVVVGAGYAGMVAAYRLQQAGAKVEVYEGSKRIGGRAYTLRSFFPGSQHAELGAEIVNTSHENTIKLVQELGGSFTDLHSVDARVQPEIFFFQGAEVKREQIIEEFRPVAEAILNDLKSLTGDVTYAAPNNGQLLDNISIAEYLDKRGISGNIRALLETAYISEYGADLDQQSSLNLLRVISTDIGEKGDQFQIYGAIDHRYRIREGADNAARKIGTRLRKPVFLEHMLESLKEKSGGGYVLTFQGANKVVEVEADDVVLAIPFTMLRNVDIQVELPPQKQQAIQELGYGSNTKLMIGFGTQVWRKGGASGTVFSDLPFQASWESSRGQGNTFGILTSQTGGSAAAAMAQGETKQHAEAFLNDLMNMFPGAKSAYNAKFERFSWGDNPLSLGSRPTYKPGQYTSFRGVEGEPVGRIFFAGDHTSVAAQGFLEGAIESGERVVKEILGVSE
ncbi:MAG: FAD-dependent oxidoreductase [Anaerolineae bacterium]|nr:FAD-dependent oxidoreductase [Anaerolineae bacterium]